MVAGSGAEPRQGNTALFLAPHAPLVLLFWPMPNDQENCIFCRIAAGELPADVVAQGDDFLIIRDIAPKAPVHLLAIPRKHIARLDEATPTDADLVAKLLREAGKAAQAAGLKGWKLLANVGPAGGQVVPHLHFHILGGGAAQLSEC